MEKNLIPVHDGKRLLFSHEKMQQICPPLGVLAFSGSAIADAGQRVLYHFVSEHNDVNILNDVNIPISLLETQTHNPKVKQLQM